MGQQEKLLKDIAMSHSGACIFQGPDAFLLIILIIFFQSFGLCGFGLLFIFLE